MGHGSLLSTHSSCSLSRTFNGFVPSGPCLAQTGPQLLGELSLARMFNGGLAMQIPVAKDVMASV